MEQGRKYRAFISYSHRDSEWADWLHRALERYRIPHHLIGRRTRTGAVPRRLYPVFRDRDELPSSSDLGSVLRGALAASDYLIVICSPASAQSRWVDEEVREFKRIGGGDRVLCLIVDGAPETAAGAAGCFCPALRFEVDDEGKLTDRRVEPIAADARPGHEHRRTALVRIVAGMLGTSFDELFQRERRRRLTRRLQVAAAAMIALLAGAGIWLQGERQAREARIETRRAESRSLALAAKQLFQEGRLDEAIATALRGLPAAGARDEPEPNPQLHAILAAIRYASGLRCSLPGALLGFDRGNLIGYAADGTINLWTIETCTKSDGWNLGVGALELLIPDSATARALIKARDGRTLLYDLRSRRPIAALPRDMKVTYGVFSPDSLRLVTTASTLSIGNTGATGDSVLQSWSAVDGSAIAKIVAPGELYLIPSLDATGRRVASGLRNGTVKVWDASDGRELLVIRVPAGSNPMAASPQAVFSPDGARILTASWDGSVQIWSVPDGRELIRLEGHGGPIVSARFDALGRRVVASGQDGTVRAWDTSTGKLLFTLGSLSGIAGGPAIAEFNGAGDRILIGAVIGSASVVLDAQTGQVIKSIKDPRPEAGAAISGFDPTGRHVVTSILRSVFGATPASVPHLIRIWDVDADVLVARLDGHPGAAASAIFSPDRNSVLTAREAELANVAHSGEKTAYLWRLADGKPITALKFPAGRGWLFGAAFGARGEQIAVRAVTLEDIERPALRPHVSVWNAADGRRLFDLPGELGDPEFGSGGTLIATLSAKNVLRIWDGKTGAAVATLPGGSTEANPYHQPLHRFGAATDIIALKSGDGTIGLWHPRSGAFLRKLAGHKTPVLALAFAPDDRRVATAAQDGTIRVWETDSGKELLVISVDIGAVYTLGFGADGAFLVAGSDKAVGVWDARSGRHLALIAPPGPSFTVSLTNARRHIVTLSIVKPTGQIWDAATGELLAAFGSDRAKPVAMAPDGARFIANSGDSVTVRRLEILDPGQAVKWARRLASGL